MRTRSVLLAMAAVLACDEGGKSTATNDGNMMLPDTVIVLKTGTFTSQNGYSTSGMVEVLRDTTTQDEFLHTLPNFSVSSGAGTIGIYVTDSTGAANLNNSSSKLFLSNINTGFSGEYTFLIPSGLAAYTHVVTFCVAAQINFGNAVLVDP